MNQIKLSLMIGALAFTFSASAQTQAADTMSPAVKSEVKKAEKQEKPLSDAEIVAIVEGANDAEISAARHEKAHGKSDAVKSFANDMLEQHQQNNKDIKTLAKKLHMQPEKSAWTDKMRAETTAASNRMEHMKGADLDRAYVDKQVEMHQHVLDKLDQYLIPEAKNEELKTLLQNTRTTVAQHLDHAKSVQKDVNGQATTPAAL